MWFGFRRTRFQQNFNRSTIRRIGYCDVILQKEICSISTGETNGTEFVQPGSVKRIFPLWKKIQIDVYWSGGHLAQV